MRYCAFDAVLLLWLLPAREKLAQMQQSRAGSLSTSQNPLERFAQEISGGTEKDTAVQQEPLILHHIHYF